MIAHVDADAFFASVLQRRNRKFRGKPLLATGMGGGCVIAASYEAKAYGVKTGMPLKEALLLIPDPIVMPADFHEACVVSNDIERILHDHCPVMERFSVDEWFLDLTSCQGRTPPDLKKWAQRIQRVVERNVDLTVSIGIAPTKLLAKMASEYHKPAGITVCRGATPWRPYEDNVINIEAFLRDRPAAAIPGIGRQRVIHTDQLGWKTAWDFANGDPETAIRLFGRPGRDLQLELLGTALSPVQENTAPPKSVSRCRSFRPTTARGTVFAHMLAHLTRTVLRMRAHGLACRSIGLWLRDAEYEHHATQRRLAQPTETEEQLMPALQACFAELWRDRRCCTQAGLVLSELLPAAAQQYSLLEDPSVMEEARSIQGSLDRLRDRYGRDAVVRGSAMPVAGPLKTKTPDRYGRILECS